MRRPVFLEKLVKSWRRDEKQQGFRVQSKKGLECRVMMLLAALT